MFQAVLEKNDVPVFTPRTVTNNDARKLSSSFHEVHCGEEITKRITHMFLSPNDE